jgi:hypothetical protein
MIDAHHLIFNKFSTEDFDVTAHVSFGGDSGATETYLNREGVYTEHYDGHRTIHRAKHSEAFTPRFTLVKKDFSDFDDASNRRILSWLTASDKPGWLEVYHDDSNVLSWRVFGCVTSVEQYKLGNGRVVGYEFEIEGSHPYAWSRKFTYPEVHENLTEVGTNDETNDYLVISEPTTFKVTCTSDEYNKVLFPKVTITFGDKNIYIPIDEDPTVEAYEMMPNVIYLYNNNHYVNIGGNKYTLTGIFSSDITNQQASATTLNKYYYFSGNKAIYKGVASDNVYSWELVGYVGAGVQIENSYTLNGETKYSKSILVGGTPKETVVLDGTNKVISSTITPFRIIGDDFNWEWIPLAEGENNITITGNCKIKFEWIEPRKVGSL